MRVLFGICSWSLGHATRDLPLIEAILKAGHELTLVGRGRYLELLKKELEERCSYLNIPDYSSPYSKRTFFVAKFISYFPIYINEVIKEHKRVKELIKEEKYGRIISDNRFGVYHREIPSYFISHQLRFIVPGRIRALEMATERFNYSFKKSFSKFLVPDYRENSLSGELSHNLKYFKESKVEYLGALSGIKKKCLREDIEYFISLSGCEPQRTILEKKILKQAPLLKGKTVIALGKPEDSRHKVMNHLHIFGYLGRKRQEEIMNRSKLIITRPGYTTLMELAVLEKKALFIPTPGQTEQIYLADYHKKKGNFYSINQDRLNLVKDVKEAKRYKGVSHNSERKDAVDRFMQIVFTE